MSRKTSTAYMGIDQYGHHYDIGHEAPRAWLMEHLGVKSARKMYCDLVHAGKPYGTVHTGWVVAGHWISVYRVLPLAQTRPRRPGSRHV